MDEVKIDFKNSNEPTIVLKQADEVYLDIYRAAKIKAREAKALAIKAHLEAKKIKKLYMLDEIESSSDEENEFAVQ